MCLSCGACLHKDLFSEWRDWCDFLPCFRSEWSGGVGFGKLILRVGVGRSVAEIREDKITLDRNIAEKDFRRRK